MYTLNQNNKIYEMQILQLQKHSGVSTMGAMGVPPTSGKNCSKFDHITMAQMAEQRLNNLWKDLETKQIILNFRFWLSKIKIIYTCYKCEAW